MIKSAEKWRFPWISIINPYEFFNESIDYDVRTVLLQICNPNTIPFSEFLINYLPHTYNHLSLVSNRVDPSCENSTHSPFTLGWCNSRELAEMIYSREGFVYQKSTHSTRTLHLNVLLYLRERYGTKGACILFTLWEYPTSEELNSSLPSRAIHSCWRL